MIGTAFQSETTWKEHTNISTSSSQGEKEHGIRTGSHTLFMHLIVTESHMVLAIQVCLTMSSVWKWTRPQLIRAILVANQFIRVFPYAKFSLSCCKIIINNKASSSLKRDWCSAYFQSLLICLNLPLQFFKTF